MIMVNEIEELDRDGAALHQIAKSRFSKMVFTPGKAYDIELRFIETRGRFEPTPETRAALADLRRHHIAPPIVPGDRNE
jgi:hypothetical protein